MRMMLMLTVGMLVLGAAARGAEESVAVVDLERLIKAHPKAAGDRVVMKKQMEEFETEQREMRTELDHLKKDFDSAREEAENQALSETVRREKIKVAEDKLTALREYDGKARQTLSLRQQEVGDQRQRMRKLLVDSIRETIRKYAEAKKIALVVDASALSVTGSELVIYNRPTVDISEDILKQMGAVETKEKDKGKDKAP